MTQSVTVMSVNNIWWTTIFECLVWAIWMEMWTMSKSTYSSPLQLHPSSWITYSSHHKRDIEASPNSPIEFWVYDFWRDFSRARQGRGSLHYGEMNITKDWIFITWICNGNPLFVSPYSTRPLKSLFGVVLTLFSCQVHFLFLFIKLIIFFLFPFIYLFY